MLAVALGQAILLTANLQNLWVVANIGQACINQVALNQSVDVDVSALGKTFSGLGEDIGSATTTILVK